VETTETIVEATIDGTPLLIGDGKLRYFTGWPDADAMARIIAQLAVDAELNVVTMPEGVRRRCTASYEFIFNHNAYTVEFAGHAIEAAGVVVTKLS